MTITAQKLYDLIPAVYRLRDAERGEPLKALLSVMAGPIRAVEEDIDALYEDWFIETCAEWLVPYLGDLLGVRPLRSAGDDSVSLRAYVANTLAYRRRKGTVAVLEELARDLTGRPAKAVEYFARLAASRHVNHVCSAGPAALQIGSNGARSGLELLDGPFEKAAHAAEVRRIESARGKYNLPHLGLYLWRLAAYRIVRGDARAAGDAPAGCWRFHPLGCDAPLFNQPQTEDTLAHLARPVNVPGILRRWPLYLELDARRKAIGKREAPPAVYFGETAAFEIFPDHAAKPLAPDEIVIGNLAGWEKSGWRHPVSSPYGPHREFATKCVVDPELGRLAFVKGLAVSKVAVSYSFGFPGNVGGGPYDRRASLASWYDPQKRGATWYRKVSAECGQTLRDTIAAWNEHVQTHRRAFGLICIADNRTCPEALPAIVLPDDARLAVVAAGGPGNEVAAAAGKTLFLTPDNLRPHIRSDLVVVKPAGPAPANPSAPGGEFIADGLLVEGSLSVKSCNLGLLHLAHCTLASPPAKQAGARAKPGITIAAGNPRLTAVFDHCLAGALRISESISLLRIADSLINGGGKKQAALSGLAAKTFGPAAEIERTTLLGRSLVRELFASETIFTGEVRVRRCQTGCVRFCYLTLSADPAQAVQTPPCYRCQPYLEMAAREEKYRREGNTVDLPAIRQAVVRWLAPVFAAEHCGDPAYGLLSLSTPAQIRAGAENGSEMGVYRCLQQPRREANLREALAEYLRSGLAAGIFYVCEENHHRPGGSP